MLCAGIGTTLHFLDPTTLQIAEVMVFSVMISFSFTDRIHVLSHTQTHTHTHVITSHHNLLASHITLSQLQNAVYWKDPFRTLLATDQLIEYTVLDIEPVRDAHGHPIVFKKVNECVNENEWS